MQIKHTNFHSHEKCFSLFLPSLSYHYSQVEWRNKKLLRSRCFGLEEFFTASLHIVMCCSFVSSKRLIYSAKNFSSLLLAAFYRSGLLALKFVVNPLIKCLSLLNPYTKKYFSAIRLHVMNERNWDENWVNAWKCFDWENVRKYERRWKLRRLQRQEFSRGEHWKLWESENLREISTIEEKFMFLNFILRCSAIFLKY